MLTAGTAGIAAQNYSQVHQFPFRAAFDDYYDRAVDIGEVGVPEFADLVQGLLVDYIRAKYGDKPADWCREYWTGDRGRMTLAHARYAGSNNNMGVEVSWRLIKKICSWLACLSQFIAALCKFIRTQLGEEHMERLRKRGDANAFISDPQPTKEMYDCVQAMHSKTLSACFIIELHNSKCDPDLYESMVEEVMASGHPRAPLHLKVLAYHRNREESGQALPLKLLDLKKVLVPRQWFLAKLDPRGDLSVPDLRALLEPHVLAYRNLVLNNIVDPDMHVKKALSIYKKFHLLSRMPTWGQVPFSCTCAVCFPNCICEDTILFTALFDPEVRVPDKWVTATISRRREQKPIGGTAGRKRRRLIEERACNEKIIDSKVKYLKVPEQPEQAEPSEEEAPDYVMPEPEIPSSSEDDFQVDTHLASDRMPD